MNSVKDLEFIPYSKDEFQRKMHSVVGSIYRKNLSHFFVGRYDELESTGIFCGLPDDLSRAIFYIYFRGRPLSDILAMDLNFFGIQIQMNSEVRSVFDTTVLCFNSIKVNIYLRTRYDYANPVVFMSTYISIPQNGVYICLKEERDDYSYYSYPNYSNYENNLYKTLCAFYYAFKLNDNCDKSV